MRKLGRSRRKIGLPSDRSRALSLVEAIPAINYLVITLALPQHPSPLLLGRRENRPNSSFFFSPPFKSRRKTAVLVSFLLLRNSIHFSVFCPFATFRASLSLARGCPLIAREGGEMLGHLVDISYTEDQLTIRKKQMKEVMEPATHRIFHQPHIVFASKPNWSAAKWILPRVSEHLPMKTSVARALFRRGKGLDSASKSHWEMEWSGVRGMAASKIWQLFKEPCYGTK